MSPFGHPTQVSMQVQLASTCDYLQVRLSRALSLIISQSFVALWLLLGVEDTFFIQ